MLMLVTFCRARWVTAGSKFHGPPAGARGSRGTGWVLCAGGSEAAAGGAELGRGRLSRILVPDAGAAEPTRGASSAVPGSMRACTMASRSVVFGLAEEGARTSKLILHAGKQSACWCSVALAGSSASKAGRSAPAGVHEGLGPSQAACLHSARQARSSAGAWSHAAPAEAPWCEASQPDIPLCACRAPGSGLCSLLAGPTSTPHATPALKGPWALLPRQQAAHGRRRCMERHGPPASCGCAGWAQSSS